MEQLPNGLYEQLVSVGIHARLAALDPATVDRGSLEPADAHDFLANYLSTLAHRALRSVAGDEESTVSRQVEMANVIARAIVDLVPETANVSDLLAEPAELLQAISDRTGVPGPVRFPPRPEIPLSYSALLVNGRDQPRIGNEVKRELASADRVDLLCAFIKWHGLRVLEEQIGELIRRGAQLRVITTTYMGATDHRAVDRLAELGAEIKVSYETRMTRLHAKAWLFHRDSRFSTAYVGSSNLSKSALLDGLEWNVRLSAVDQSHIIDTFAATFDEYWEDPSFEPYDPADDAHSERLRVALEAECAQPNDLPIEITTLDVRPWGFQREILEELEVERTIRSNARNLVVMATGTGKTVVAALDYRRLRESERVDSLLFVAHREEILKQSVATFRHVMRDGSFGERFVAGSKPRIWRHVFASVQSLARLNLTEDLDPEHFDMVIVDEFHHASPETKTYARLLRHVRPRVLLGLTATPERADGQSILEWFGGRISVELRLWEALERGLLAPFQYFGISDGTDLRSIRWKRGSGYDTAELTNIYTGHDARVRVVLQALRDKVTDLRQMRALGFCVSIDHAEFMASRFNAAGVPSRAVTSRTPSTERQESLRALRNRKINVVFAVDLFNEGVDIPEVDTVLFLRPTESPTIFLQQLGRGLRLAQDKPCLTVLDFVGQQHAKFRFDLRFRALTGLNRHSLEKAIEHGFPSLPAGCQIDLDRVAAESVLQNIKSSLRINWRDVVDELRRRGDCSIDEFLEDTGLELADIYRPQHGGWTELRRLAGIDPSVGDDNDSKLANAFGRMLHVDDLERLKFFGDLCAVESPPNVGDACGRSRRLLAMLHFSLWGANASPTNLGASIEQLWANTSRRYEFGELTAALTARARRITRPVDPDGEVPLHVHARYSRDEALAAFGIDNPGTVRQGVKWVESEAADVFFVTLRKTVKHYSPTTMYQDRAITPSLFQWESQSTTSEASPTGQRYMHHREQGTSIHIFIRETKEPDGKLGAPPYLYAGRATYVSHSGDRPLRIIWKLDRELPADVFHAARVATG